MPKIALVVNEPPPYRVPIFNRIAQVPGVTFQVIFCCRREPNRKWNLPPMQFDHVFLRERITTTADGRYIHNNPDVIAALHRFSPDVIITNGFNPTHLYTFAYAMARGVAYVPMTDGTDLSERGLSKLHRLARRTVYSRSRAFIAASTGGDRLYHGYGIAPEKIFRSCLCTDNDAFLSAPQPPEKTFDFIFCGRMEEGKRPLFALEVAAEVAKKLNRKASILFVGSGSLEQQVRDAAASQADLVDAGFHGFATQQELPALYRSARMFLFPTAADVWGVVANEACAAGLPVLVSPHAGVAGELVRDGENGHVCELDVGLWTQHAARLLMQPDLRQAYAERSLALVSQYTFGHAAAGILDACRFALPRHLARQLTVQF
jgi:glycosyltransferase involved in cell wall biosynthesis